MAAAANVNLASLHYHFGSKENLLEEIFAARAGPIAAERIRLLEQCADGPGRPPLLEADPRGVPAAGPDASAWSPASAGRLLSSCGRGWRRNRRASDAGSSALSTNRAGASSRRCGAPRRRCRGADLEWRFHFLLGAMVYTMANNGRIQALTDGACDPSQVESALHYMIPFFAAGFRSEPAAARPRSEGSE